MRRIGKVQVSLEFLSEVLRGGVTVRPGWRIETTAPDDLQVVAICPGNMPPRTVWVYCESITFAPVESIEDAPELEPFEYTVIQSS